MINEHVKKETTPRKKSNKHLLLLFGLDCTSAKTSTTCSDETGLLTRRGVTGDSGSVTNVLMVSSSVGMIEGVHSHTSRLWPAVSLDSVFVESAPSLQKWFVHPSSSCNDPDRSPGLITNRLLRSARQSDPSLSSVGIMPNNSSTRSRSPGQRPSVSNLLLNVTDDGPFWDSGEREDVPDVESRLLPAVDERTSRKPLSRNEQSCSKFVAVGISENDLGEGGTTARIVDDIFDQPSDVPVLLGVVESPELGSSSTMVLVSFEDST